MLVIWTAILVFEAAVLLLLLLLLLVCSLLVVAAAPAAAVACPRCNGGSIGAGGCSRSCSSTTPW